MFHRLTESLKEAFSLDNVVSKIAWAVVLAFLTIFTTWLGSVFVRLALAAWIAIGIALFLVLLMVVLLAWTKRRKQSRSPQQEQPPQEGEYETFAEEQADGSLVLGLKCTTNPRQRPAIWRCRVTDPERPKDWEATMSNAGGDRSEKESPPGELRLRFPQDFDGVPRHLPAGWYKVEWSYPMLDRRTAEVIPNKELVFAQQDFCLTTGVRAPVSEHPSPPSRIRHRVDCPGARIEVERKEKPSGEPITVTRCMGCGEQVTETDEQLSQDPGLWSWIAWHSQEDPEDLGLRGVNLYVRSSLGRKQPVYLCEVTAPDGSVAKADLTRNIWLGAKRYEEGVTVNTTSGVELQPVDNLHFLYPSRGDFFNPPEPPLDDGVYRVRWKTLGPVGGRVLKEDLFEIQDGRLVR